MSKVIHGRKEYKPGVSHKTVSCPGHYILSTFLSVNIKRSATITSDVWQHAKSGIFHKQGSAIDNAAIRLLPGDKSSYPFLATLPNAGTASLFALQIGTVACTVLHRGNLLPCCLLCCYPCTVSLTIPWAHAGSATYITALKPCGQIAPHIHPRATEQYVIISGEQRSHLTASSPQTPYNLHTTLV